MPSISVSNLELYRMWREDDDLDLEWLLKRLRGQEPQTEAMMAGEALHAGLETIGEGELSGPLVSGEFKFYFLEDCEIEIPTVRELPVQKQYGPITVRGRVDGIKGLTVRDYKSTAQFDADRLLNGFQWRFYLDMTECDNFEWKVFVIRQQLYREYQIFQIHELKQHRYAGMEAECERLARDFWDFAQQLEDSEITKERAAVLQI